LLIFPQSPYTLKTKPITPIEAYFNVDQVAQIKHILAMNILHWHQIRVSTEHEKKDKIVPKNRE